MAAVRAIMCTMTTYGTWLRGDARGWVDAGEVRPPDPLREDADRKRMKHPPFRFEHSQLIDVGGWIGDSLTTRLDQRVLALTVQSWHVHFVVGGSAIDIGCVVKCAKDAARWGLRIGRPIWSDGYDKRFCFDDASVAARVRYVERHNEAMGWGPRPWSFITSNV